MCGGENACQVKNTQACAQRERRGKACVCLSVGACTPAYSCVTQRLKRRMLCASKPYKKLQQEERKQ